MSGISKIEYRVRPVTRYVVTRLHRSDDGRQGGVETKGEYDNESIAFEVGYALCRQEHNFLGFPLDDERIVYPQMASPPPGGAVNHASDCVINNAPAFEPGECDCGFGLTSR